MDTPYSQSWIHLAFVPKVKSNRHANAVAMDKTAIRFPANRFGSENLAGSGRIFRREGWAKIRWLSFRGEEKRYLWL
jgi:hypothetical protein